MTCARSRHARGFTLTELLVVLILLSAFAIAATRLFNATFHLSMDSHDAQNATAGIDSALAALRSDVWSAKSIETSGPGTAKLAAADGTVITWTLDDALFHRTIANDESCWPSPGAGTSFATDGVVLIVKVPSIGAESSLFSELALPSETSIIAKLTP